MSIDTVLGAWVPRPYGQEISSHIGVSEDRRRSELDKLGHCITGNGEETVRRAFADYLTSMERFLVTSGVEVAPVANRDALFDRFLASRQKLLADAMSCARLARRLELTPMPDIWMGDTAIAEFEMSFFEDLAYRMSQVRKDRIIRSVAVVLGVEEAYLTPEEVRSLLDDTTTAKAWTDDRWLD